MKKAFLFLTAAVMAAFVAVSCNTKDEKKDDSVSLDTPALDEHSLLVNFDSHISIPIPDGKKPDGNSYNAKPSIDPSAKDLQLNSFEAMNDGSFGMNGNAKDSDGGTSDFSFSGKFDIQGAKASVGTIYNLLNWGTLEITGLNNNKIDLKYIPVGGGDPIMLSGTLASVISGDASLLKDAGRAWKVEKTFVTVKSESLSAGIGGEYNGCNFKAIAQDLKDKGLNIDPSKADYSVAKIALSKYGTVKIFLSNDDVIEGKYQLSGSNFSYDFDVYDENNPILSGTASGSLKVVKGKLNLEAKGTLKDNAKKDYEAEVKFILVYE